MNQPQVKRFTSWAVAAALCLACWAGGIAVRRTVLDAQRMLNPGGEIPFTLESALAFRRIQQAGQPGGLPEHDCGIGWPAGIDVRATDTTGEEGILLALARHLPWSKTLSLAERVRWLHLLWWSLSIPALFLLVRRAGGGTAGATVAAAFWAVAVTAVARSTGQELSHENVAWPLWAWHLASWTFAAARQWRGRAALFQGIASALFLALALCAWDLVRFWLAFVGIWAVVRVFRGHLSRDEAKAFWCPLFLAYVVVTLFVSYHTRHGLLLSPLTLLLAVAAGAARFTYRRWHLLVLLPLAAFVLVQVTGFMDPIHSYGHFSSLLWAKLRYFNIRPTDPAKLTFEQRILWTPALNSTSVKLLGEWLPALGWLAALAVAWTLFSAWSTRRSSLVAPHSSHSSFVIRHSSFWTAFFLFSFFCFILFFRFHVWMAWAACILSGLLFGAVWRRGWVCRGVAVAVAGLALWAEASNTLDKPVRWGRPNVYAVETAEMLDFLNREVAPEPVLANFGISGSIATYAGCPVVLHPKFETRDIREAVRGYLEALFKGDENAFADWMDERGATVYVHSMGELSDLAPELSPRFMVDALDPAPDAAVRLFEQRPRDLKRFKLLFQNRKFRVYRLLPPPFESSAPFVCPRERPHLAGVFEEVATRCAAVAGYEARAWAFAIAALRMDPDSPVAQELVRDLMEREPEDEPYDLSEDPWALEVLLEPPTVAPARSADGWLDAVP